MHLNPFEYLSGKVSRSEYINKFRPEYELIEYLNKTAPENSRVLALFLGRRGYYFENEVRFGTEPLLHAIKVSDNETDIANQLRIDGFTHVILGFDLFNKWIQDNLEQEEYIRMKGFFDNQAALMKQNDFYALYQLTLLPNP